MAKHRTIQQWDHWLTESLGHRLLEEEQRFLSPLLADCYGKHALLIGVPRQYSLMKRSVIPHQVLLSPLIDKSKTIAYVEGNFCELPIASASIDLTLMPHVIEYVDNPRRLLGEACRVVKPGGYIVIVGFNPYSLWGLKKQLTKHRHVPWSGHFIAASTIKKWLDLVDFELVQQESLSFRPPLLHHPLLYQKLKIIEWAGRLLAPSLGGVYILMAKAKVIPLTPIRLQWKQKFSGLKATFPVSTIRNTR